MITYVAFNVNLYTIFSYVMKRTVLMDTRDTFFCNQRYLTVKELPEARYLTISENDYRIFSPSKQIFSTWRLKCISNPPGYRYWPIMSAQDLAEERVRQKVKIFKNDIEALHIQGK